MNNLTKQKVDAGKQWLYHIHKNENFDPEHVPKIIEYLYHYHQYAYTLSTDPQDKKNAASQTFFKTIESLALWFTNGNQQQAIQLMDQQKRKMGREWMNLGLCTNDQCSI